MPKPGPFVLARVAAVSQVTPQMTRVTFGDLPDFAHIAPDQQVKLFFPRDGQGTPEVPQMPADGDVMRWYQAFLAIPEPERPWMRSYSVRTHRPAAAEVDIDFVVHGDGGPASRWANQAKPGDVIGLLGPAVSHLREPGDADWWLLTGDETALPAISALLESFPAGRRALAFIEVADAAEEQKIDFQADVDLRWLHRDGAEPGRSSVLVDAVTGADFPAGVVFAWVAGEASAVRTIRRHLVDDRGVAKKAIAFAGYWRLDRTQDDAPSEDEILDAQDAMS